MKRHGPCDGAIWQGTYSGDGITGERQNPVTALWEGGLIFSEDTWQGTVPCSVSQENGLVCSHGIVGQRHLLHSRETSGQFQEALVLRMISRSLKKRETCLCSDITEEIFVSRNDGMGQGIVCGDITGNESLVMSCKMDSL